MEQTHKHSVLWYRIYEPTSRFWIILLGFWKNGKTENWCQEWKDTRILLWRPHTIIPSWVWSQIWWSQNLQDWRYVSSFMLVSQISLDFRIFFLSHSLMAAKLFSCIFQFSHEYFPLVLFICPSTSTYSTEILIGWFFANLFNQLCSLHCRTTSMKVPQKVFGRLILWSGTKILAHPSCHY